MPFAAVHSMNIKNVTLSAVFGAIIALSGSSCFAGEFSAVLNGKSYHIGASEDWNEDNLGLGVEFQFDTESRWKRQLMANGFRDSSENMTYMVGGGIHRTVFGTDKLADFYVDLGINAFVMTREDVNDNRPFPGALPSLTIGNRYAGFNLTYLPRKAVEKLYDSEMMDRTTSGIVFLQFKVKLNPSSYR